MYPRVFTGGILLIPNKRDCFFTFTLNRIIEAEAPLRLIGIYSLARGLYSRVRTWSWRAWIAAIHMKNGLPVCYTTLLLKDVDGKVIYSWTEAIQ